MRSRQRRQRTPDVAGLLVLAGIVVAVLLLAFWKALLVTAAILVVPFSIWWVVDRQQRRAAAAPAVKHAPAGHVDPVEEAIRAGDLGMPGSADYWRGHYGPGDHDEEAKRRRDRTVAADREAARAAGTRRAEDAKDRFYERQARVAQRDGEPPR